MSETVLRTKLFVPPLRPQLVHRASLIEKLNQGFGHNAPYAAALTLLSAPAGSGKTTLLSQFVDRLYQPVAWLSLDEADDDPGRFWAYLITACQNVLDGFAESTLALLNTAQTLPVDTIPTMLINDLLNYDQPLILILDDYHTISDPSIHQGLSFLLDYRPPNFHIVISTRVDPPWPLSRYRARHQLIEIRARDLRFTLNESTQFFSQTMGLSLTPADVAALEGRTEGWIAGLQLAAIAMQSLDQEQETAAFVKDFTGSHLYVAEYMLEEILRRQPEENQTFLLTTSILERLNPELCDALTERQDSRDRLRAFHRANLFLIPLDGQGSWYRYHHLFADLLQARLTQELSAYDIACLHKKAAVWFEQHGLVRDAIKHALVAQDYESVAALVEREARGMMFAGQARTLSRWLESLPETSFQTHPRLRIFRLWLDLMQERVDLSPQALREKEHILRGLPPSPENEQLQVELIAVLCRFVAFSGDTARAIRLGEEALARLPDGEHALRARAHSALALSYWMEGDPAQAQAAYDRCVELAQSVGDYSLAAHATMMLAMSQTDYGQLHAAARTYQSIIDMGQQSGQKLFFPAGQGYIGLASIYLEWNDLPTAEDTLQKGMTLCRQGGLAGLSTAHTLKARLYQARGELHKAVRELERLGAATIDPTGKARQILLRLAIGDLEEAARLAGPWLVNPAASSPPLQPPLLIAEIIKITLAHLFYARGELQPALKLLEEVQETAVIEQRNGRLIEVYLLQALIIQKQNHGHVTPAALNHLARSLQIAEPQGYTLLFLEAGTNLMPLLQALINRPRTAAHLKQYARKLLAEVLTDGQPPVPPALGAAAGLVEPLTPRETEVLQLVATGATNQDIAGELVITVRTVKKHMTNILGKLSVSNRTQAVARARELGLLTPS